MRLVGHSLGGYLAVAYAERFPERVERLVLLSPVGLPQAPLPLDPPSATEGGSRTLKSWQTQLGSTRDSQNPADCSKYLQTLPQRSRNT